MKIIEDEASMSQQEIGAEYLSDALRNLRSYKKLAEEAFAQTSDEDMFRLIDADANSIAILIKHMAGNMRSRWTDFLTSDGEKPNRNRDSEFVQPPKNRADLMQMWNQGWDALFHALERLSDSDLQRSVTIRGEPHSVMQAINRQIAHYAYHCGQIVFLAKHLNPDHWKSLSVPRNKSAEFNRKVLAGEASQR